MTFEEERDDRYELVMPFVLVASEGGPFEDAAFVSGWRMGDLDAKLATAKAHDLDLGTQTCLRVEHPQIDLLAMRHGFTVRMDPADDDWAFYEFERTGE